MAVDCWVIGVLDAGLNALTPSAMGKLQQADVVIGDARFLEMFASLFKSTANLLNLTGKLAELPQWIMAAKKHRKAIVVLATGDPLCYGIAVFLKNSLPPGSFQVLGAVSTLQLAFERICEPWHDAVRISVHGKDNGDWTPMSSPDHSLYPLYQAVLQHHKIGIFTSPANGPDRIARLLLTTGLQAQFRLIVVEKLGLPDEAISPQLTPNTAASQQFQHPNIVILFRQRADNAAHQLPVIGIADNTFQQRTPHKGLITRMDIRAITLARLGIYAGAIMWDVGAGSGSVGLEAARLCPQASVYGIEKNLECVSYIRQNQHQLGVANYHLITATAPAGLEQLPDPNAVFIGGSGGQLQKLIELTVRRLQTDGRLVMNFVTLENLHTAIAALKQLQVKWDVTQVQIAKSKPLANKHRLDAEIPIWITTVQK